MTVADLLDLMEETLDDAMLVPLTGKRMVNAEKMKELIDEMRVNFPREFKKARDIVRDRDNILDIATQKADEIVSKAEARVQKIINEDEVVKNTKTYVREILESGDKRAKENATRAQKEAEDIVRTAQQQSYEMRQNAYKFTESVLRQTEGVLEKNHKEVRQVHADLVERAKGVGKAK